MSDSKNPYEIRLELLKLSKDLLVESFFYTQENIRRLWEDEISLYQEKSSTASEKWLEENRLPKPPKFPEYPTENEVVEKAEEFYKFIKKKD